ncbi:putative late blight resistance protein -like protein R1C-3-like isoform X1 [Capsicum annuum]|nr:putative late blight resistance protein -like protein R1C-3-like isoform X1 [Capsicum annuum]
MGDCLVVQTDRLVKPNGAEVEPSLSIVVDEKGDEEVPLIGKAECRICQEEDSLDKLESPCACSGSLKGESWVISLYAEEPDMVKESLAKLVEFGKDNVPKEYCSSTEIRLMAATAGMRLLDWGEQEKILEVCHGYTHRTCVQHWCNEKGDITCEICHQQYQPGYTVPPRTVAEETIIDIGGGWQISGTPLDLHDPRVLAIAEAEHQLLEAEYEDYNSANASGAAFCRSAALILMALLLLRHALPMTDTDGDDDDPTAFFSLFLLRAVGFLLPCYIMLWAISILQQRRQREEAAALAATQFAVVVHSGQPRGLQFTIASAAPATPAASASVDHV